jgi:hypothetical protein
VEWHADAALPVTLRNVEALLPLPPLPAPGASPPPLASLPDAKADPKPEPASGLTKWWQGLREHLLPEASEVQGRRLRVDDPKAIPAWMRRVVESQEDKGHYDYEADKYIVEHRAGEKSLFDAAQATEVFKLPKPLGRRAFEVIGIPFERPGFYVVELASPRLGAALYGKEAPFHAQSSANLGVHLKLGRESSLVWVTSLDQGRPVAGAEVVVSDCEGKVYFEGQTGNDGVVGMNQTLPRTGSLPECLPWRRAFFVTARLGEDLELRHVRLGPGDLAVALQPSDGFVHRAEFGLHGLRPHLGAGRRDRAHEALRPAPSGHGDGAHRPVGPPGQAHRPPSGQ